jgi:hypothetical protein
VFAADGNGGNINAVHGQKGCFVNCNVWLGFFFFFQQCLWLFYQTGQFGKRFKVISRDKKKKEK